jgi:hypothetical protein
MMHWYSTITFGAGDLHEQREFIKDIKNLIPAKKYHVAHGKDPNILKDLEMEFIPVNDYMPVGKAYNIVNNDLYLNCWIGRDGRFVLPQVGCVIEKNYEMFNDILKHFKLKLSKSVYDYLPEIDFSYFDLDNINKFVKQDNRYKVLICNGPVHSCQAENFDFTPVIERLCNVYNNYLFITTQETNLDLSNLLTTRDIIQLNFDLNEIAYLALFVDTVVGRKSGPFVVAHTRNLWYTNKNSISFTYAKHSSHFVLSDHLPLRKYWSNAITTEGVYQKISEVIGLPHVGV